MSDPPPNRDRHNEWLTTANGCAPGTPSSSATNKRPAAGRTPSTVRKSWDTTLAYTCSAAAATAKVHELGRQVCPDAGKRRTAVTHRDVVGPRARPSSRRHHRPRVALDVQLSQRCGVDHAGRRLEEQRIDDAEDGGRAADADGERGDRGGGEAGLLAQQAERNADVLPHALDDGFPAGVAHTILHGFDAADLDAGGTDRGVAAHAVRHLLVDYRLLVLAQLVGQLLFGAGFRQQGAQAADQPAKRAITALRARL